MNAQPGHHAIAPGVIPTPRAILLSLARHAAPHALLVLNAGRDGAALLSLPTSEYLQSSGWTQLTADRPDLLAPGHAHNASNTTNGTRAESVRSASDYWAAVDGSFASQDSAYAQRDDRAPRPSGESFHPMDDDEDEDEDEHGGRDTPQPERREEVDLDEEGAHAAFVAGMIWALSRRVLPGAPYVPGLGKEETKGKDGPVDVGLRWRLDECLRCVVGVLM